MSSFLVDDKSICTIASVLCDVVNDDLTPVINDYFPKYHVKTACEPFTEINKNKYLNYEHKGIDYIKTCHMLFGLNCRALNVRYGDENFPELAITPRKNASILISDNIQQVYKTIQCYLYQCNESAEIVSDPLFKACESLKGALAEYHMERSNSYAVADWN